MSYILIIIGLIFLFNPCINLLDFLPDFIGYLLIGLSINKLSKIDDNIYTAKKRFNLLILVSFVKLISILFNNFGDTTYKLLIIFSFAIIEAIIYIIAFNNLFDGISYVVVQRANIDPSFYRLKDKKITKTKALSLASKNKYYVYEVKNGSDSIYYLRSDADIFTKIKKFTLFFMIYKNILTILPELYVLNTDSYFGSISSIDYASFYNLYIIFAWILTLIVAIPWLISIVKFFNKLKNNSELNNYIEDSYSEKYIANYPKKVVYSFKSYFSLLIIGIFFLSSLMINRINIAPSAVFGLLISILSILIINKYDKQYKISLLLSIILVLIDIIRMYFEISYFSSYTLTSQVYSPEAATLYSKLTVFYILSTIISISLIIAFFLSLRKTVLSHVPLISSVDASHVYNSNNAFDDLKSIVNKRFVISISLLIVIAISSLLNILLVLEVSNIFGIVIVVQSLCYILLVFQFSSIYDEVYKRIDLCL